jgi:ribosomal protein L29
MAEKKTTKAATKAPAKAVKLTSSAARELSIEARVQALADKKADLIEKRKGLHSGELMNPSTIRKLRRDIAILLTIEKEAADAAKEETK